MARDRDLPLTGLIGLLDMAAERKIVPVIDVVQKLRATSFRVHDSLLEITRLEPPYELPSEDRGGDGG